MNICVLTHTFPRNKEDSAAAFMKKFADGLVLAGSKVVVVTPYDKKFKRPNDPFKIVMYKYIYPRSLHLLGYSRTMEKDVTLKIRAFLLFPLMFVFGTITLLKVVRKEKIDLINVHWLLPNGLMAFIVSKLTGIPYVVTLPGTDVYLACSNKLFGWVARIIAKNSSGIVALNQLFLNRIAKLKVNNIPTRIIHYPVDSKEFYPSESGVSDLRKKFGFVNSNIVIMAIGRLVYKKGFEYLIKAMPRITKRFPNVRLVIGGAGDLMGRLTTLATKLKVDKKIVFTGNVKHNEILSFYNLADIMVTPSVIDPKGNADGDTVVSFESMVCGKPLVVTDFLGVSGVIKDGVHGFIVHPKNSKELAYAIEKLIKSGKLRRKMGRLGRELVEKQLSPRQVGKEYVKFFKQIVS
ncbi:MAG: glycosyltransferase family 4 protein [Patescibacteria group bacterium]